MGRSMKIVISPNLPQGRVGEALLSELAHNITAALEKKGITVIKVKACRSIAKPVSSHADLLYHHLGGNLIAAANPHEDAAAELRKIGFNIIVTEKNICSPYPADAGLDAARVGRRLICNLRFTDKAVLDYCEREGLEIIAVKQGYAKCSVCVVDECSIITADAGIAAAAEESGLTVLRITEGCIQLPGLSHGFIGGCCGKLAPNLMVFTGNIKAHPDYCGIKAFMEARGVEIEQLCDGPLTDIGGIIPLIED
jgi:ferredoxin